jgi:predicted signal transduction protein with EAL and GGDEF domain
MTISGRERIRVYRARAGACVRRPSDLRQAGLKLDTVAEGVQTQAQLQFLQGTGCGKMQGYLFSRPLAAGSFERLVQEHRPQPATT